MLIRNTVLSAALFGLSVFPASAQDAPILGHQLYGTGPEKVVALHNWMGDASSFDALRSWIDGDAFTFAFADVRGYGASKAIEGAYTTDEIAADVLSLADHLGWDRFHLVGHSMNGMAGFKTLLHDHGDGRRIKSFVAITPVTPDGYPASEEDRAFLWAAIDDDETAMTAFAGLTGGKLNATWAQRNMTVTCTIPTRVMSSHLPARRPVMLSREHIRRSSVWFSSSSRREPALPIAPKRRNITAMPDA